MSGTDAEQIPYNGTEAQGANPLDFDVNLWYNVITSPSPACGALRIAPNARNR
jgi:hypothetical protein